MNAESAQEPPGVLGRPVKPGDDNVWRIVAALAMVLILLLPAILNGFPLVYADTGGYLARPFEGTLEIGRSAFYGAFLAAGIALDFWPNIVVQAVLTVVVLMLTLRTYGLGDNPWLAMALTVALAALTGLPWYVDQLMPDIFLSLTVLALHLLAFRSRLIRPFEAMLLVVLIAAGIASHMAILGLAAVMVLALVMLRPLASRLRLSRPRVAVPALALVAGLLIAPLSNLVLAGSFAFTPGGTSFVFGRLLQDGIITRYLDDHCPDPTLKLCAVRHALPATADDWLWSYDSELHKLGGWPEFEPEARRIIRETLTAYPGQHLATAIKAAAEQFVTLRTGDGIRSQDNHHALSQLERLAPNVAPRFAASWQQHDRFDFAVLNAVQVPLALLCMALLALALLLPRRLIPRSIKALAFTTLLALAANAAISGVLSGPYDRYQSRLAWLAPFAAVVATLRLRAAPRWGAKPAPLP
jgi:hypothetical protein